MAQPRISAVIPAHNAAAFLAEAVASVRAQTVPIAEIVVVDDGSTDDTAAVAEGLAVTLIRQPNAGPAAARNRGVAAASGEWIAFLDADDQWTPEKTGEQLAAVARHPELALVASDMAEVAEDGRVLRPSMQAYRGQRARFEALGGVPIPRALRALIEANFIPTGTVLVRRAAFDSAGGFDERIRYGEDLELWARIAAVHPIACLPAVHMLRRRHGANATDAGTPLMADLVDVMEALAARIPEALRAEDLDPDRLVADALANLGYHHFDRGELGAARTACAASLRRAPNRRAAAYWLASCLPKVWVRRLRRLKQNIAGLGDAGRTRGSEG